MTTESEKVELDGALYLRYLNISHTIASLKKEQDELGEQIRKLASGDTVFTYAGAPVFRYAGVNQFRSAAFIKDNPDAARQLMTTEVKEVLNVERIKRQFPALYEQYRTYKLTEIK